MGTAYFVGFVADSSWWALIQIPQVLWMAYMLEQHMVHREERGYWKGRADEIRYTKAYMEEFDLNED